MEPNQTACRGCGGALSPRYPEVEDPQTRERFSVLACQQCGLGHTSPQPEDLSRYYGAAYHGGRHGFTASFCAQRRLRWVESLTGGARGRKLLDLGCGDGTFLLAAREKGWGVMGTEMNPSIARGGGLEVAETVDEVAGAGPFGCITLWHSLEHMRDPRGVIERAARLLSPDGALFVAVPDAQGLQARLFGPRWFHLDVPRHLYHFGDRSLTCLLDGAGLEVVRRWHQEIELDLFGWAQSALNAVLPDPNVFFYRLTGRKSPAGAAQVSASYLLGSALVAFSLPLVPASAAAGRGGMLIMASRPRAAS
ncbi:MAG: class I SAM-dependent methyltransferase [Myxococcales bacterium]|nr:class I SAM-dependent methyltransferase [Myxococcales bacterium]